MSKIDIIVMEIYMNMLLDGSAFSNWTNKPDKETRNRLVESIMGNKKFTGKLNPHGIRKVIMESKNEEELKRMLAEMQIDEDEFLV